MAMITINHSEINLSLPQKKIPKGRILLGLGRASSLALRLLVSFSLRLFSLMIFFLIYLINSP